ncbi:MAG: GNAT family N-acetyltransferase, partial [Phycicoccus sp.]
MEVSGRDTVPEGRDRFDAWAAVFVDAAREVLGDDHDERDVDEVRAMESGTARERHRVAAVDGGVVVGAVDLVLPRLDNRDLAELRLAVLPDRRRRGIGSALLHHAEGVARHHGRTVLLAQTDASTDGADPAEPFATTHDFRAGQRSLRSDLALPVGSDRLTVLADPSDAGGDYTLESCVDVIPEEWLEDRAELARRMSTDIPLGELALEEEVWDADRLREEWRTTRAMGRRVVETVARHVPSGRLVGFTHVEQPDLGGGTVYQHDTLVLREHRGHGLGLRLKAANPVVAQRELAGAARIRTWNAVENAHMLAVNRALGYRLSGRHTAWQKRLGDGL